MPRVLKKVKPKVMDYQYMTMDIETVDDNGVSDLLGEPVFISWCVAGEGFGKPSRDLTGWFMDYFLTPDHNGWILYVHNGFNFDYKRIKWELVAQEGYEADFVSGKDGSIKAITLKRGKQKWYVRDSLLLTNMSLAKLTKTFAPDHQKIKRAESFEYKSFDPNNPDDVAYAIQDSVALFYAIANVNDLLEEIFGVQLHDGATLPSLAFRAFRIGLGEQEFDGLGWALAHAARESYHGGQTLAFNTDPHPDSVSVDCNSMYPYVMMRYRLPTGEYQHRLGMHPQADPDHTLCLAVVSIPDGVFPFLKTKGSNGHTGNFRGVVIGWYWLFELEYQKHLGGDFRVVESYEWFEDTDVCEHFSRKCHDLRMSDYHGPRGAIAKLINNSLYGKFAQEPNDKNMILTLSPPEGAIAYYDPNSEDVTPCVYLVDGRPSFAADMVHWASFITAKSRLELTRAIETVNGGPAILGGVVDYCDTDSIFFERLFIDRADSLLGAEYGQFKIEKDMKLFRAVAPKAYKFEDMKGVRYVKNKGIPMKTLNKVDAQGRHTTFDHYGQQGQVLHFISANSMAQVLTKGAAYGRQAKRTTATVESTTNGTIKGGVWVPGTCQPRTLEEVRGRKPTRQLQMIFDRAYREMCQRV